MISNGKQARISKSIIKGYLKLLSKQAMAMTKKSLSGQPAIWPTFKIGSP